jgi:hypothetical protein
MLEVDQSMVEICHLATNYLINRVSVLSYGTSTDLSLWFELFATSRDDLLKFREVDASHSFDGVGSNF